jgi:hypothetical protein
MSPGGRQAGWAKLPGWTDVIYPFYDAPDVGIPIVWYEVPDDAPAVPPTVFTDRNWDRMEGFERTGVGTAVSSMRPYFGPRPTYTLGPLSGTDDQWLNGCSHAVYLAGGYSNAEPCAPISSTGALYSADAQVLSIDDVGGE